MRRVSGGMTHLPKNCVEHSGELRAQAIPMPPFRADPVIFQWLEMLEGRVALPLNFKSFGAGGEHLIAGLGDGDGVFDADAAKIRIIEAGLDGDDHSGFEFLMVGG